MGYRLTRISPASGAIFEAGALALAENEVSRPPEGGAFLDFGEAQSGRSGPATHEKGMPEETESLCIPSLALSFLRPICGVLARETTLRPSGYDKPRIPPSRAGASASYDKEWAENSLSVAHTHGHL